MPHKHMYFCTRDVKGSDDYKYHVTQYKHKYIHNNRFVCSVCRSSLSVDIRTCNYNIESATRKKPQACIHTCTHKYTHTYVLTHLHIMCKYNFHTYIVHRKQHTPQIQKSNKYQIAIYVMWTVRVSPVLSSGCAGNLSDGQ